MASLYDGPAGLDDPRDPPAPPGEPPVEEPGETPPTREEPGVGDPAPSEAPMIA